MEWSEHSMLYHSMFLYHFGVLQKLLYRDELYIIWYDDWTLVIVLLCGLIGIIIWYTFIESQFGRVNGFDNHSNCTCNNNNKQ